MFLYKNLFFDILYSFNPNLAYWNQRRLFSGNLPGMFKFISKDRGGLLNCSVRVCWPEVMLNFSKFYFLWDQTCFFSGLALNLLEVNTLKLRTISF